MAPGMLGNHGFNLPGRVSAAILYSSEILSLTRASTSSCEFVWMPNARSACHLKLE